MRVDLSFFPYDQPRKPQVELIEFINQHFLEKRHLLVESANGTGKTIVALSSLLPFAKDVGKKIVYLCRTHDQMDRVLDECRKINKTSKYSVGATTIRSRQGLCLHPLITAQKLGARDASNICTQLKKHRKCEFYLNYLDQSNKVVSALRNSVNDTSKILDIASAREVCPYELAKKISRHMDVISLSYQYFLNPRIRSLILNQLEISLNDIILVLDEAHNLAEVVHGVGNKTLSSLTLERAAREAEDYGLRHLKKKLETIYRTIHEILNWSSVNEEIQEIEIELKDLVDRIEFNGNFFLDVELAMELLAEGELVIEDKVEKGASPISFLYRAGDFLQELVNNINDDTIAAFLKGVKYLDGSKGFSLELVLLDPKKILLPLLRGVYGSLMMSGTLGLMEDVAQYLGLSELSHSMLRVKSSYSSNNLKVLVVSQLSTRLKDRTPETFKKMIELISDIVEHIPKNVGIFVASYDVMEHLKKNGLKKRVRKPLLMGDRSFTSEDNRMLVNEFKAHASRDGAVLLEVLGGRTSEGSDFPGDYMNGVIIVGVPFAQPTPKVKKQIEYLEEKYPGKGKDYGYFMPAVTRAAQAIGRPIRSPTDRAVAVLLDYRFNIPSIKKFFPDWIKKEMRWVTPNTKIITREIDLFFSS